MPLWWYGLNVCPSCYLLPPFISWKLILTVMFLGHRAFGRWWLCSWMELVSFEKGLKTFQRSFERALVSSMWGHSKVMVYEPGSGLSPDTKSAGILMEDFPAPELWELNLLLRSHPVFATLLQQSEWTDECPRLLGLSDGSSLTPEKLKTIMINWPLHNLILYCQIYLQYLPSI